MTTTFPRLALLLTVTAAACSPDPLTAPLDPVVAKGGRPGGGATAGIVPIKLGNPKDIGCSGTQVEGVSAGLDPAAPTLAVGFGFCAGMNKPFIWSSTEGLLPTGGSPGQMARAASDNGVVVGGGPNHTPVVFDLSGNVAVDLPMPAGYTWGTGSGITPDGRFAVGYGGRGNSSYALRWARSTEGSWSVEEIGPGWPVRRVSAAGDLVVGTRGSQAVAWRLAGTTWTPVDLPAGGAARSEAYDVNGAGTVIVGVRELPLARDPTVMYDEHVAWIAAGGGGWVLVPLKGTDPNLNEGAGFGVADRTSDGSTIVAGFSWENTSGPGGKQWAVVWRRARGATAFDPPVRLQPLSKTGDAMASGVNARGEVVGIAWTGSGSLSVMWRLPAVP